MSHVAIKMDAPRGPSIPNRNRSGSYAKALQSNDRGKESTTIPTRVRRCNILYTDAQFPEGMNPHVYSQNRYSLIFSLEKRKAKPEALLDAIMQNPDNHIAFCKPKPANDNLITVEICVPDEGTYRRLRQEGVTIGSHTYIPVVPTPSDIHLVKAAFHCDLFDIPPHRLLELFAPYGRIVQIGRYCWRQVGSQDNRTFLTLSGFVLFDRTTNNTGQDYSVIPKTLLLDPRTTVSLKIVQDSYDIREGITHRAAGTAPEPAPRKTTVKKDNKKPSNGRRQRRKNNAGQAIEPTDEAQDMEDVQRDPIAADTPPPSMQMETTVLPPEVMHMPPTVVQNHIQQCQTPATEQVQQPTHGAPEQDNAQDPVHESQHPPLACKDNTTQYRDSVQVQDVDSEEEQQDYEDARETHQTSRAPTAAPSETPDVVKRSSTRASTFKGSYNVLELTKQASSRSDH
ncbi:hypothetical protein EDD11_007001 [Mortierella claussenii]|nr:hypothetical protein EDD11_007001 [Mortierella claussenii]